MEVLFRNAKIYEDGKFKIRDIAVMDGKILSAGKNENAEKVFDNVLILPGLADVHVHLREPGFSYKETIKSGTEAGACGGYTALCTMPNLNPVPDSPENLKQQLDIISKDACIRVYPFGSVTKKEMGEELSDFDGMAADVCGFSDDGKGIQNAVIMEEAMKKAKSLGKIISAHCEVNELLKGGYIHDGIYAKGHGHKGICSESEYAQIERDIELAKKTGCRYHVCHISAKESVGLIRQAKKDGVDITCETAPHYLLLSENDLKEEGRFKMNPPLRSREDREALIEGICDGTIDMIATDHAPHSLEEKSKGLKDSLMGVTGLETAFPLLYTHLVLKEVITIEKLVELMSVNPKKRFGIDTGGDFTVFGTEESYEINPEEFHSMGRATPFEGWKVRGRCLMTVCGGKIVYYKRDSNGC